VVQASRDFVCVRLATYENADEFEFMTSTYDFRTPTKNSLFAILDPSGEKHLVSPGRSMKRTFEDGASMASRMEEIAKEYPSKRVSPKKLGLPYLLDVRVGLNVAACDSQRLVILFAPSAAEKKKLEALLLPLAWNEKLAGNLLYATTSEEKDLEGIEGATKGAGLMVVEPDPYGMGARQVTFIESGTKPAAALKQLLAAAEGNEMGSKDSKRHIGRGLREGVQWEQVVEDKGLGRTGRRRD